MKGLVSEESVVPRRLGVKHDNLIEAFRLIVCENTPLLTMVYQSPHCKNTFVSLPHCVLGIPLQ